MVGVVRLISVVAAVACVATAAAGQSPQLAVPAGDVARLGSEDVRYLDPEVLHSPARLTFVDGERSVWLAHLDPLTGMLLSSDGRDVLIDTGHTRLELTNNGSEFAVDRDGWSVIYSKEVDNAIHTWRATVDGDAVDTAPATSGEPTLGAVASKNPAADSTRILAIRGSWEAGDAVWIDLDDPSEAHVFTTVADNTDGRWIDGTSTFVHVIAGGTHDGQLALVDTDTGESRRITDDAGAKTRPYGWPAPEVDGEVRVMALVDDAAIGVWEDRGGVAWERVMTLGIPEGSDGTRLSSPEPFVAEGRSWATVSVINESLVPREIQIWVLDLGDPPMGGSFRCDDGHPIRRLRSDPESFYGSQQVFVYYYVYEPDAISLYRAATGIRTDGGATELPRMDFAAAHDYSVAHGGGAMLVSVDGELVYEAYAHDETADSLFSTASAGKSVWGVNTLAMIANGDLSSPEALEESAASVISEWQGSAKAGITHRHLHDLVSGLTTCRDCYSGGVSDTFAYAIHDETLQAPPGTYFEYGAVNHFAWGNVVERLTGTDAEVYFTEHVSDPIGMSVAYWPRDDAGNPRMHGGLYMTARDLHALGRLVADRGRAPDGSRVIPEGLIDLLWDRRLPNPGNAMFFWQNHPDGFDMHGESSPPGSPGGFIYHDGYPEMIAALGAGPQILAIFPAQRMVVLRQKMCNTPDSEPCQADTEFELHEFFDALFADDRQPRRPSGRTGRRAVAGRVVEQRKISAVSGGLPGVLAEGDNFGRSVASLGDVDGDGVTDIAVGAFRDDDGGPERGSVYILFMTADGRVGRLQKISETEGGFAGALHDGDNFGSGLAGLGDVNGDGVPDLAVGAHGTSDGGLERGAVWILLLADDGRVEEAFEISDTAGGFGGQLADTDRFGVDVASVGDIDGDGVVDLAVGALFDDQAGVNAGAVWILRLQVDSGTVAVGSTQKITTGEGGFSLPLSPMDRFGRSVAGIGDVNADGVPDLAVGANGDDDGATDAGALYILTLNADATVRTARRISQTDGGFGGLLHGDDLFGSAVAPIGDIDANGVGDLLVGAQRTDAGGLDRGGCWVLLMSSQHTVEAEQKISEGAGGFSGIADDDVFGVDVAWLGDLDGDGLADVAVGAPRDDDGAPNAGAVWLLDLQTCPAGTPSGD